MMATPTPNTPSPIPSTLISLLRQLKCSTSQIETLLSHYPLPLSPSLEATLSQLKARLGKPGFQLVCRHKWLAKVLILLQAHANLDLPDYPSLMDFPPPPTAPPFRGILQDKLRSILLRGNTPPSTIEQLLKLSPLTPPGPSSELLTRLTLIEARISSLPRKDGLIDEWTHLATLLWAKYAEPHLEQEGNLERKQSNQQLVQGNSIDDQLETVRLLAAILQPLMGVTPVEQTDDTDALKKLYLVLDTASRLINHFTALHRSLLDLFRAKLPAGFRVNPRVTSLEALRTVVQGELSKENGDGASKSNEASSMAPGAKVEPVEANHRIYPSADAVFSVLQQAFSAYRPLSVEPTLAEVKALLVRLRRARSLLAPYGSFGLVLRSVFALLYALLTDSLRAHYKSVYPLYTERTLANLDAFLGATALGLAVKMNERKKVPRTEASQGQACVYCRKDGHQVEECEERLVRLCTRCFTYGHTHLECKEEKVEVTLADFGQFTGRE